MHRRAEECRRKKEPCSHLRASTMQGLNGEHDSQPNRLMTAHTMLWILTTSRKHGGFPREDTHSGLGFNQISKLPCPYIEVAKYLTWYIDATLWV